MYQKFLQNIEENSLLKDKKTVLIGLSGGYDSMALALAFVKYRKDHDIRLVALHVNHGVREEAGEDEAFVKSFAEKNAMDFHSTRVDMEGYAKDHGLSEEDAGRRLRYDYFYKMAESYEDPVITTGHNLPDQTESFLLNLIRGAGLRGLRAMDFKTGMIIRPLLNISREEIESFVNESGWTHVEDMTNHKPIYRRNSLRLDLIPRIKEDYNPAFEETIFRTTELLKEEYQIIGLYIEGLEEKLVKKKKGAYIIDKEGFNALPYPARSHLLRRLMEKIKGDLSGFERAHYEEFIKTSQRPTGRKTVINGLSLEVSYDSLVLKKEENLIDDGILSLEVKDQEVDFGDYRISFEIIDKKDDRKASSKTQYFSLRCLDEIMVRTRRPGDRMRPFGMKGTKKVKDLMIDEKVPRYKRDFLPIILDGSDIIWVTGLRRSSLRLVDESDEKILKITIGEKK